MPPIGNQHAFFSDDMEPCPITEIADLIRDSYEVVPNVVGSDFNWNFETYNISNENEKHLFLVQEIWRPFCGTD